MTGLLRVAPNCHELILVVNLKLGGSNWLGQSVRKPMQKIPDPNLIPLSTSLNLPESTLCLVVRRLYSIGGRPATPRDLERVRDKYNIPHSVRLRVPRKGECPEHPHSDGIAFYIDLFDLGLRLPLQLFFRKMFTEMKIAPR